MDLYNKYHWCIFRFSGIRLDNRPTRFKPVFLYLFLIMQLFTNIYTVIGAFLSLILLPFDFAVFCGTAFPSANFINTMLRQFYMMRNHETIKTVAGEIAELIKENDGLMKSGTLEDARNKLRTIQKAMMTRLIVEWAIPVVLFGEKFFHSYKDGPVALPLKGWNPFDINTQPENMIMIIFQMMTIHFMSTVSSSQECVLFDFMILQSVQARHLADDLDTIFKDTLGNRHFLLGRWVKQHQKYRRICGELRKIFSPILFFYYTNVFTSLIIACLMVTDSRVNFTDKVAFLQAGCLFFFVFFLLCRVSDYHHKTEQTILSQVLSQELVANGRETGKAVIFIKTLCNKVTRFSAYGLYPLSSESFGVLSKASFSFMVTLFQLKLRKEGATQQ